MDIYIIYIGQGYVVSVFLGYGIWIYLENILDKCYGSSVSSLGRIRVVVHSPDCFLESPVGLWRQTAKHKQSPTYHYWYLGPLPRDSILIALIWSQGLSILF